MLKSYTKLLLITIVIGDTNSFVGLNCLTGITKYSIF